MDFLSYLYAGRELKLLSINCLGEGITACFSTRLGGVSSGVFSSLNLGFQPGEVYSRVLKNRQIYLRTVGISPEKLVTAKQVHGNRVRLISFQDAGRGALNCDTAIPDTDGLITKSPGICLGALFADCVPIFVHDPIRKAVAIAHAGWRGTLNFIAAEVIQKMQAVIGTDPRDCLAAVGPSIGSCCYEVDEELADRFKRAFSGGNVVQRENGKIKLNLKSANASILLRSGLKRRNIFISNLCTACQSDLFYSYRASGGQTGRMMGLILLKYKY